MKSKRITLLCISAALAIIMCFNFVGCEILPKLETPGISDSSSTLLQPTLGSSDSVLNTDVTDNTGIDTGSSDSGLNTDVTDNTDIGTDSSTETDENIESNTGSATQKPTSTKKPPATTASTNYLVNPDFPMVSSKYGPGFDLTRWTYPIWEGTTSYAESCFVQYDENGDLMPINTLYPIKDIVSIRSGDLQIKYKEGRDYNLVDGKIVPIIGGTSRIKALAWSDYILDSPSSVDNGSLPAANTSGYGGKHIAIYEVSRPNGGMLQWTIQVTYTHDEQEVITKPADQSDKFEKITTKLKNKEALTVVSIGDSITNSWSATMNAPSSVKLKAPNYNRLLIDYMKTAYDYPLLGNKSINHTNLAVSGSSTYHLLNNIGGSSGKLDQAIALNPDLVILAFAMNDACDSNLTPQKFVNNINTIMNKIRTACPDVTFLVVGTFMPNELMSWSTNGSSMLLYHKDYIPAMKKAAESWTDAAYADVGSVHIEMMEAGKAYNDTAGSGSNHPNDYMHRVYAQVCIQTIFGEWVEP